MNLAEMLNRGPLQQQRMADEYSMARDLSRSRQGTIQDPAKASQYRPHVLPGLIRDESPAPIDMRGDYGLTDLLMGTMPMAGITAFHGSPHKFSKFDMSRIGTGEGAQAYGHGLYFAERPEVAKEYADVLGGRMDATLSHGAGETKIPQWLAREIDSGYTSLDDAIEDFSGRVKSEIKDKKTSTQPWMNDERVAHLQPIVDGLKESKKAHSINFNKNLYKVDIPDDQIAKMLDWDKPFNKQTKVVEDSFAQHYKREYPNRNPYEMMADRDANAIQTEFQNWARSLRGNEVTPGIKYLDQGSRQGGKGTSNFVLFDDQIPQILAINDEPIARALAGR